jgi:hypothetical protein
LFEHGAGKDVVDLVDIETRFMALDKAHYERGLSVVRISGYEQIRHSVYPWQEKKFLKLPDDLLSARITNPAMASNLRDAFALRCRH